MIVMRKKLKIEPTMGVGGILVADRSCLLQQNDAEVYDLTIAIDVDGSTDLTDDFPGQSWKDVWHQKTSDLAAKSATGRFAFCILHSGEFNIEITDEAGLNVPNCALSLPTGELCVVEIDSFGEQFFSGRPAVNSVVKLSPGDYLIEFEERPDAPIDEANNVYGTDLKPIIVIKVVPRKGIKVKSLPTINRFDFRTRSRSRS